MYILQPWDTPQGLQGVPTEVYNTLNNGIVSYQKLHDGGKTDAPIQAQVLLVILARFCGNWHKCQHLLNLTIFDPLNCNFVSCFYLFESCPQNFHQSGISIFFGVKL